MFTYNKEEENITLTLNINKSFFVEIQKIMGMGQEDLDFSEHLQNSLEIYADIIQAIADGKTPTFSDSDGKLIENLELPYLLSYFKKQTNKKITKIDKLDIKKHL